MLSAQYQSWIKCIKWYKDCTIWHGSGTSILPGLHWFIYWWIVRPVNICCNALYWMLLQTLFLHSLFYLMFSSHFILLRKVCNIVFDGYWWYLPLQQVTTTQTSVSWQYSGQGLYAAVQALFIVQAMCMAGTTQWGGHFFYFFSLFKHFSKLTMYQRTKTRYADTDEYRISPRNTNLTKVENIKRWYRPCKKSKEYQKVENMRLPSSLWKADLTKLNISVCENEPSWVSDAIEHLRGNY